MANERVDPKTISPIPLVRFIQIARIGDGFTHEELTNLLMSTSRAKKLSDAYIAQHIAWITELRLVEQNSNGDFVRLPDGKILANTFDGSSEQNQVLNRLLLRNKVYLHFIETLFRIKRFDRYVDILRAGEWIERTDRRDNKVTPKRLCIWATQLGLLAKLQTKQAYIVVDSESEQITLDHFWRLLEDSYFAVLSIQNDELRSARIPTLRDDFCWKTLMHPVIFDQRLIDVANSEFYNSRIQLISAPARYIRELERKRIPPLYIGKKPHQKPYLYIRILGN
jgi:hypothetical protein